MNDEDLANLLGEKPSHPDPGFRLDVFSRVAHQARRRVAWRRAANNLAVFTAIGLFFPLTRAAGFEVAEAQPLFIAAATVALSYFLASAVVRGPAALVSRSLSAVGMHR